MLPAPCHIRRLHRKLPSSRRVRTKDVPRGRVGLLLRPHCFSCSAAAAAGGKNAQGTLPPSTDSSQEHMRVEKGSGSIGSTLSSPTRSVSYNASPGVGNSSGNEPASSSRETTATSGSDGK